MNTQPKSATKMLVNQHGKTRAGIVSPARKPAAPAKQSSIMAKPKAARSLKTSKMARKSAPSSQAAAQTEQLVCRYCGSADLAPSFIKRRDARCRACFRQRYGSTTRLKKTTHIPKAKAAR